MTAVLSVATIHIPLKLGLVISVLAGVIAAVVVAPAHVNKSADAKRAA